MSHTLQISTQKRILSPFQGSYTGDFEYSSTFDGLHVCNVRLFLLMNVLKVSVHTIYRFHFPKSVRQMNSVNYGWIHIFLNFGFFNRRRCSTASTDIGQKNGSVQTVSAKLEFHRYIFALFFLCCEKFSLFQTLRISDNTCRKYHNCLIEV